MTAQYQTKAVQALAGMWEEYKGALENAVENMPMVERSLVKGLMQVFSVEDLLVKLDGNPKAVEVIKKGLARVIEAMMEDEIKTEASTEPALIETAEFLDAKASLFPVPPEETEGGG